MPTSQRHAATNLVMLGFAVCLLLTSISAHADVHDLLAKYKQINGQLEQNVYGIPIYLESNGDNGTMRGDVFGLISHPFSTVSDAFSTPANWCEIVPTHLNVKACTYRYHDGGCGLTIYSGRKFYEKADDVYMLDYLYKLKARQKDYVFITLTAEDGPLDTGNYIITAEAVPVGESATFIHFSYSYDHGFITSLAMSGYFATLGSDKIGFTVVEKDDAGEPVYVDGIRGVIERNSMRYYFAIQSYLDTLGSPDEDRFLQRINNWFDLTEKYARQLHELDKQEYLDYKRLERDDQLRLQSALNGEHSSSSNGKCLVNAFRKQ